MGWIGVDLDGTLAMYTSWRGSDHIGEPVTLMLDRVKTWLSIGLDVRIMTARVSGSPEIADEARGHIYTWCETHIGRRLPVVCCKDYAMVELWDDRCIQVIPNTGRTIADELESERAAHAGKP